MISKLQVIKVDGKTTRKLPLLLSKLFAKLRGRPWEQPQSVHTSSSSLISPKLIVKVILVAAIAAAWQYFSG